MMEPKGLETEGIDLLAEIGLHEQCMRERPGYKSGVRPNHWISGRSYCFIGEIHFKTNEWLRPGQTDTALVKCLIAKQDKELFKPGFCWHITEVGKIVGYGKVINVVSAT